MSEKLQLLKSFQFWQHAQPLICVTLYTRINLLYAEILTQVSIHVTILSKTR